MKTLTILALLALGGAGTLTLQGPEPAKPTAEHEWLKQLVGEWNVHAECVMEPGAEPMEMESTSSVRTVGDLWIVAEGSADFGGQKLSTILQVGYDPAKKAFVGTWIDSMHTYLWNYRGSLDEAKKTLTLETRGPVFGKPTEETDYRDAFEVKSDDHYVLTSTMKDENGEWQTYMTAHYRKK